MCYRQHRFSLHIRRYENGCATKNGIAIPAPAVPNFLESFREVAVAHINKLDSITLLRRDGTATDETNTQQRSANNNVLLPLLNVQLGETNDSEMVEDDADVSENDVTPLLSPELLSPL